MNYLNTRVAGTLLAFGIFFALSCTSTNQTSSDNSSSLSSLDELQNQLNNTEQELQGNERDPRLNIEKATLLFQIAEKTSPPSQRIPLYRNLKDLSDINFSDQSANNEINEIVRTAWSYEQGEGVKLLQRNNSVAALSNSEQIADHFNNAITVNPDSLVTYNLLANTYYRSGRFDDAIQTLQDAIELDQGNNREYQEKLAYIYLESGDIETSINYYNQLVEEYPQNAQIRHGLANAYMLNNDHDSSITVLRDLINDYPNRIEYKESLAGELYFTFRSTALQIINSEREVSDSETDELLQILSEISNLYEEIDSAVPLSDENAYRKAAFLKNSSQYLADLSSNSTDDRLEEHRVELLNRSLELWERLTENNPDNINYIRNLYEIYVDLEMTEEAESLKRSYNL